MLDGLKLGCLSASASDGTNIVLMSYMSHSYQCKKLKSHPTREIDQAGDHFKMLKTRLQVIDKGEALRSNGTPDLKLEGELDREVATSGLIPIPDMP